MKRTILLLFLSGVALFARPEATDGWHESQLFAAGLRHADIALMPEGTPKDYALFASLRPTVVAWGEDALPVLDGGKESKVKFTRKREAYRQLGVKWQAANVWMLTATERYLYRHPELLDATCIDLWGGKILPPWLSDAEFKGVKPWWGCTNNPQFQAQLLARMNAGLAAGATMIHLDDHSGTLACATFEGGCFCGHCVRGFREWLERNVDTGELAAGGIPDVAALDYRAWVLNRGYADREAFITAATKGSVPLWDRFLAFQRDAAIAFIRRMQADAAQTTGHPVAFGVNSYNLLPVQLFDAHVVDYFANEVEQFDKEDSVPPVVYRLGEALGRPTFATGTGEDWIKYRQSRATTRVRGWIAEAYAFGQYFMYAWKKWGFSEKTGTLWTEVDPEIFRPMNEFVSQNPDLFNGFENAAAVGLLYDNGSVAAGHWGVREASKALLDAGVPYGLVVAGDKLLQKPLRRDQLDHYRVVVVPGDAKHTDSTNRLMAAWEKSDGALITWPDKRDDLRELPGRIEVQGAGRVWALPRVRHDRQRSAAMVLHFLNRDYDATKDIMIEKTGFHVALKPAALGGPSNVRNVRYYKPGAKPRKLKFQQNADGVLHFEVPDLDIWGIAEIK